MSLLEASGLTLGVNMHLYWVGVAAFFGVLLVIYRLAGRWGWIGIVIRAGCGLLVLVKILTLIADDQGQAVYSYIPDDYLTFETGTDQGPPTSKGHARITRRSARCCRRACA